MNGLYNLNLLSGTSVFMDQANQLIDEPVGKSWDGHETWDGHMECDESVCPVLKIRELRRKLLDEEFNEYLDKGENADDLVETVDGLLDIIVIAYGTLLAYIGPEAADDCAREVVRSNLDKVVGEGLPIFREDGKVLKPEGWTPPDIVGVLKEHGYLQ